jgi:hypothetical protein
MIKKTLKSGEKVPLSENIPWRCSFLVIPGNDASFHRTTGEFPLPQIYSWKFAGLLRQSTSAPENFKYYVMSIFFLKNWKPVEVFSKPIGLSIQAALKDLVQCPFSFLILYSWGGWGELDALKGNNS